MFTSQSIIHQTKLASNSKPPWRPQTLSPVAGNRSPNTTSITTTPKRRLPNFTPPSSPLPSTHSQHHIVLDANQNASDQPKIVTLHLSSSETNLPSHTHQIQPKPRNPNQTQNPHTPLLPNADSQKQNPIPQNTHLTPLSDNIFPDQTLNPDHTRNHSPTRETQSYKTALCKDLIQNYGTTKTLDFSTTSKLLHFDSSTHISHTENTLSISLPSKICTTLSECWQHAIIFVLPEPIKFTNSTKAQLLRIWDLKNSVCIKHLGLNHYILSNIDQQDRFRILSSPPWFLFNYPLLVRSWFSNFSPSCSSRSTSVWVSLPHLPIEYFCAEILSLIGNSLGKLVALDQNNLNKSVLSAARMCIELDIMKNHPSSLIFNGIHIPLCYEHLSVYHPILFTFKLPLLPTPSFDLSLITKKQNFSSYKSFTKSPTNQRFNHNGPVKTRTQNYPLNTPAIGLVPPLTNSKSKSQLLHKNPKKQNSTPVHLISRDKKAKDKCYSSQLTLENPQKPAHTTLTSSEQNIQNVSPHISPSPNPLSSPSSSPTNTRQLIPYTQHLPMHSTSQIFPLSQISNQSQPSSPLLEIVLDIDSNHISLPENPSVLATCNPTQLRRALSSSSLFKQSDSSPFSPSSTPKRLCLTQSATSPYGQPSNKCVHPSKQSLPNFTSNHEHPDTNNTFTTSNAATNSILPNLSLSTATKPQSPSTTFPLFTEHTEPNIPPHHSNPLATTSTHVNRQQSTPSRSKGRHSQQSLRILHATKLPQLSNVSDLGQSASRDSQQFILDPLLGKPSRSSFHKKHKKHSYKGNSIPSTLKPHLCSSNSQNQQYGTIQLVPSQPPTTQSTNNGSPLLPFNSQHNLSPIRRRLHPYRKPKSLCLIHRSSSLSGHLYRHRLYLKHRNRNRRLQSSHQPILRFRPK